MSDEFDDAERTAMPFSEISEASLEIASRVSAAFKKEPPKRRGGLPKIGLETVLDADGNGTYFLPDPAATNWFADLVSRMAKLLTHKATKGPA